MSQQGPILIVSSDGKPSFATALDDARLFPVISTDWRHAAHAVGEVQPAAILAAPDHENAGQLTALAQHAAARKPYLPLIVVDPAQLPPHNGLPFTEAGERPGRLMARLQAALRVRTLHTTVLRRLQDDRETRLSDSDPIEEATVLLLGRGGTYPALSVALGERMRVLGALSMEAAGKHLNNRQIDGIVLADGFSSRVVDAFLTVLAEDARFRHMPVVMEAGQADAGHDLANLELVSGDAALIAGHAAPLIRQRAFEARLGRALRAIEAGGLLDARTGLLTPDAFCRDLERSVQETLAVGGGLALARFAFDRNDERAQHDAARIISHLMRKMDIGTSWPDGSVIVVFADTGQRAAQGIARRLSSVIRQTSHGRGRERSEPAVTIATLLPSDTPASLLARLYPTQRRAAS